ncbi:response regulator transcription factor [Halopenitus persicus]|uniref:Response regulator receiver domain-containing protein n=1 Tax=Halopenitus persicus TaxID=1048396 RepID=A0A1H3FKP4_9EURY|nr:response regulator [Halopenitus persicus]SDX91405.1 Response regulator receiver domain-containing protein [Halopenitus persicus]
MAPRISHPKYDLAITLEARMTAENQPRSGPDTAKGDRTENETFTVLLADDDDAYRETLSIWLADDRWNVREATNGREAIEELDEEVDALVLDRRMPELSGPEVVHRLAAEGPDVPVLVLSAYRGDDHLSDDDVETYLTKPMGRSAFVEHLERVC